MLIMERLCGGGGGGGGDGGTNFSSSSPTRENLEMNKCHFHLVQFLVYLGIILVTIFLLILKKYTRWQKAVKGRMFRHHFLVWTLTLTLFLCTACLCAERLIIILSTPNLSGLDSLFSITFRDSSSSSSGGSEMMTTLVNPSSAPLYFSLFAPTSFLIALCLVAYLYHQCERTHEPKFLLVHILLYLFTSVLSWSTLYLNFVGGLTIFHVQVLGNIFEGLTTGILSAFLIHMFCSSQKRPAFYPVTQVDLKNVKYLHYYAPLLSRITFFWLTSLLRLGYRRPLEEEDLGDLPPEEKTAHQFERFQKNYREEKEQAAQEPKRLNLWRCMFKTLWSTLTIGGFFRLAADCSGFVAPLGIKTIVNYAGRNTTTTIDTVYEDDPLDYLTVSQLVANGYVMACIILLATLLQSTFSQCSTFLVNSEGIHIKIALQTLIYNKSLTLCTTKSSQGDQNSSSSSSASSENEDHDVSPKIPQQDEDDAETVDDHSSSPGFDNGSISNLMSEDTNNIMMFFWNVHFIWAIPLKLTILMVLLYLQLGYSALIGAAICIAIMIPLQYLVIAKYMSSNSQELMERCDERLRAISEMLQGMKLLKLNGWELIFSTQVFAIRKKELENLDKDMLYRSIMTFLTHISSVVVTLVTFGLYSYIEDEKLVPSKVFAGLALFNQLTVPLFMFPNTVPVVIDALVSVRRVREFLLLPEATPLMQVEAPGKDQDDGLPNKSGPDDGTTMMLSPKEDQKIVLGSNASIDSVFKSSSLENIVEDEENDPEFLDSPEDESADKDNSEQPANEAKDEGVDGGGDDGGGGGGEEEEAVLVIRNGDFSWDEDRHDHGLTDISLKIARGKLIVVVGPIGSGKSSLIFALLGEMRRVRGQVLWSSGMTIAYAGQKPWMLNASVRENITFGRQFKPRRYMRVIQACALQEDINILPERDATEIGDKGINLSGGQKQRIAIGRALYSDASVVILDDPLSALDVDVAHHVFDAGIRKFLLRSKRTVILVTHHLPVLHHAHHIISMEKGGRIRIQGTLADIKIKDPTLHALWTEIMTKKEAEIQKQTETKTAKERWSLLKHISKISLQFRHRNSDAGTWKVNDDPKPQIDPYRKRKGTFSHYKNLTNDIFSPSDEHHDELMTPLLRRRFVSKASTKGSRTSSSSNTHPELVRMTSLQNDTTSKVRSPLLTKKIQRLQSLPGDSEPIIGPSSSPPSIRARSGTDSSQKLQENMFRKLLHAKKIPENSSSVAPLVSESEKTPQATIIPAATTRITSTSGISEGEEEDEEYEEESLRPDLSREEREYGTIAMKVYFSYIAACGNFLSILYLVSSIGYEVIQVYKTFWLGQWSDTVSQTADAEYDNIMSYYFNIYVLLSVFTVAVSLTCNLVGKEAGANSRELFHRKMLNRIVRCPMRFFEGTPTGRIITRFASDMAFIDRKLCISMQRFLQFVFMCVSAICVNAIVNPWILVGAFPVITIYFFIQRFFRFSSRELQRLEAISRGPIYSHFHETLEGLSTIRAYSVQNRFVNQMLAKIEANNRAAMFINVGNRWLSTSLDYLGSIIVFLATLASMVSSYLYPEVVTPSMVGLAISYILLVPVYLNQVVKFLAEVEMYMNSVERVNRYSELDIEDYDDEDLKETKESIVSWEKWPSEGLIEFDDISVQYGPGRPPIITDLKVRIPPKQKVGICGRSGSGKSTLLMALFRISDISKGKILIDGQELLTSHTKNVHTANEDKEHICPVATCGQGFSQKCYLNIHLRIHSQSRPHICEECGAAFTQKDIHSVPLVRLRSSLSIIPQENILFSGTIRFNLDPANTTADADIWRALELCQMKDTVKEMPGQLDAEVKDGGATFSAGQKQLFGLARAILHKSKVVIMDEATSSVDLATERTLLQVVKDVFKDCTVLTIAHRLDTIVDGDRVLVLDAGGIAEDGHPARLRQRRFSKFADMLRNADEQNKLGG